MRLVMKHCHMATIVVLSSTLQYGKSGAIVGGQYRRENGCLGS